MPRTPSESARARRLVAVAAALTLPLTGLAQTTDDGWTGQVTPYVWATGIGGTITPYTGARTMSFSKSISQTMKDADAAFFLSGYARKDRFVLLGDLSYSSSSKEGTVGGYVPGTARVRQRSLTLAAGYRAWAGENYHVDLLGGVRSWKIEGSVGLLNGLLQASQRESIFDPILALRANLSLGPRWSAIAYADVGGFGVGSHATSQLLLTANYQVNDQLYLSAGYRRLALDYRRGGTRLDVVMAGPVLGATWRF